MGVYESFKVLVKLTIIAAIFFVALSLGWLLGKSKKKHPAQIEPDEPWPRIPELDAEAGKKWEADHKRKEEDEYARQQSKGSEKKGKGNRKGPADKVDGAGSEVGGG